MLPGKDWPLAGIANSAGEITDSNSNRLLSSRITHFYAVRGIGFKVFDALLLAAGPGDIDIGTVKIAQARMDGFGVDRQIRLATMNFPPDFFAIWQVDNDLCADGIAVDSLGRITLQTLFYPVGL